MFNSMESLPKRVLIDTNVLLDAAFVNGAARRSLAILHECEYSLIIDESIEIEAVSVLGKYQKKFPSHVDLNNILSEFVSTAHILRVPPAGRAHVPNVNKHDAHVVSASKHYSAWVLTGDSPLYSQILESNMQARSPIDVLMTYATRDNRDPQLSDMITVVAPSKDKGLIFARVQIGSWGGTKSHQHFTVCDVENIGRIYYDDDVGEWVFRTILGITIKIRCPVNSQEQWAVCGSYNLPSNREDGKVFMRVGRDARTSLAASQRTIKRIQANGTGAIRIGSALDGSDYWNGHFRSLVVGPQGMATDTWKCIVSIPDGAPNPYDSEMLSHVLNTAAILSSRANEFVALAEEQLRNRY